MVALVDDIGRDRAACNGDHPQPVATRNIDRLAAEGLPTSLTIRDQLLALMPSVP